MMNKKHLVLLAAGAITLAGVATAQADTLADTKERGAVQCGVSDGLPGFSAPDDEGNWQGLDVDVCQPLPPPFSVMLMR